MDTSNFLEKFSGLNGLTLIEAIHAHPCLWDAFHKDHCERTKTRQAWMEVARAIQPNFSALRESLRHSIVVLLMKRWRNMRDCYVKDLRLWSKGQGGSPRGSGSAKRRKYIFFDQLSFLRPSVEYKLSSRGQPLQEGSGDSLSDEEAANGKSVQLLNSSLRLDPLALIQAVEKTPLVWDITLPGYAEHRAVEGWLSVCRVLYPRYDDLQEADRINILGSAQKMWRKVKDQFRKDWKDSLTPAMRQLRRKKHVHFDSLKFLLKNFEYKMKTEPDFAFEENSDEQSYEYDDWLQGGDFFCDQPDELFEQKFDPSKHREDSGTVNFPSGTDDSETQPENPLIEIVEGPDEIEPQMKVAATSTSPTLEQGESSSEIPRSSTRDQGLCVQSPTISGLPNPLIRPPSAEGNPLPPQPPAGVNLLDEDLAFFYSILPTVRKMDVDQKLEFRLEVMRSLQSLRRGRRNSE